MGILRRYSNEKKLNIGLLGLKNSGKKTILRRITTLSLFDLNYFSKMIQPGIEEFQINRIKILNVSLDDQEKIDFNPLLRGLNGIIIVINSSESNKFNRLRSFLWDNNFAESTPILILANKQDLPIAKTTGEISRVLNLNKFNHKKLAILSSSAVTMLNINVGIKWLFNNIY